MGARMVKGVRGKAEIAHLGNIEGAVEREERVKI